MDEVAEEIHRVRTWCLTFADDVVWVEKNREEVNNRLNKRRLALEGKGLNISRSVLEFRV